MDKDNILLQTTDDCMKRNIFKAHILYISNNTQFCFLLNAFALILLLRSAIASVIPRI